MMAMQRRIGDADVKAKFAFVCIKPEQFTDKNLYELLRIVIRFESERISNKEIDDFKVFLESLKLPETPIPRTITNQFVIDGEIGLSNVDAVEEKIKEKLFHQMPAFKKAGKKSIHPPRWLTTQTLVFVVGSPRFLMRNVDLYLEREGLLRDHTFDLMIEVGTLGPFKGGAEDYFSVDVAHKGFYRGYVEELGRLVGFKPKEEDLVYSTANLKRMLSRE